MVQVAPNEIDVSPAKRVAELQNGLPGHLRITGADVEVEGLR